MLPIWLRGLEINENKNERVSLLLPGILFQNQKETFLLTSFFFLFGKKSDDIFFQLAVNEVCVIV